LISEASSAAKKAAITTPQFSRNNNHENGTPYKRFALGDINPNQVRALSSGAKRVLIMTPQKENQHPPAKLSHQHEGKNNYMKPTQAYK